MSICKISYEDGVFLDDDALLYDNALRNDIYGDLIPVLHDMGTCVTFETDGELYFTPMPPIESFLEEISKDKLLIWQAVLRHVSGVLREPFYKVEKHELSRLLLPSPVVNPSMYLLGEGAAGYFFFILCGLKCRDLQDPGWPPLDVAEWMAALAEQLRSLDVINSQPAKGSKPFRWSTWLNPGGISVVLSVLLTIGGENVLSRQDDGGAYAAGLNLGDAGPPLLNSICTSQQNGAQSQRSDWQASREER